MLGEMLLTHTPMTVGVPVATPARSTGANRAQLDRAEGSLPEVSYRSRQPNRSPGKQPAVRISCLSDLSVAVTSER